MKVLIYGINYSPELTGIGKYSGEMVKWMVSEGMDVRVITAPPYYPDWKVGSSYSSWWYKKEQFEETVYRCPLYVPKKPTTLKRLIHLCSFAISSFFPLLAQIRWKPDYIICVAPTLVCAPGAIFFKNITKTKTILHIQDFEVDAMLGLGMAGKGGVSGIAKKFESWCLKSVDIVSTISHSMMNKALDKGVEKDNVIFFPNWSEVSRFQSVIDADVDRLKKSLNIPDNKKIILYSGNIGEKQGLDIIIDVAARLPIEDYQFVLVGQGGGKENLENLAIKRNIKNISFLPLQPYEVLPALLKIADCHLVIQRKGAADAVLPSKLTNILAAGGNALITAEPETELGRLCQSYPGIGVCVEPESADALLLGIEKCLSLPAINTTAMQYARESLVKENVLNKFIEDIRR